MKKAQFSSQFNWIYILLVGGFILTLFITLSTRQQDVAEVKINAISLEGISTIFEAARTGNSLSTKIEITELTMGFHCEEINNYIYSDYTVNSLSKRMPGVVVFAPPELTGRELITWTYSWEMPYKVMNFFYIVNSKVHVYFYLDDSYSDFEHALQESFSENIAHEFVDSPDKILDANDDLTIIVIDDTIDPSSLYDQLQDFEKDVVVVQVTPYGPDVPPKNPTAYFGDITFYDKETIQTGKTQYFGLASLYGAIISGDKEYYECTMKKAVERLKRVSCIYNQKYAELESSLEDPDCKSVVMAAQNIQQHYLGYTEPSEDPAFCYFDNSELVLGANDFNIFDNGLVTDSGMEEHLTYNYYLALRNQNRKSIGESCESLY